MTGDRRVLDRLLGPAELAWLRERVRARALSTGVEPLTGVVRLDHPTPAQRDAVTRLVGPSRRAGASLRVDLADVEAVLRRGPWPAGLVDAVVTLTGPVVDVAAGRREVRDAWERAAARLTRRDVGAWWDEWCAAGGLKRAARSEASRLGVEPGPAVASRMVDDVARLLEALPAAGVPIAVLARQVLGDSHALDADRALGRLAVAVVGSALGGDDAGSRREVWAAAGVVLSHVASTVLSLGVPGSAHHGTPLARATSAAIEAMRTARSPLLLTLDQVRSGGVSPLTPDQQVHVCENPTVVEVVARRWAVAAAEPGPVLVCTSGQPSTAVLELLDVLASRGAGCRYHGDFDWAGVQIADVVHRRVPWTPWRFAAADYLAAVGAHDAPVLLRGRPVDTPWDPDLGAAMAADGRAVEEEAVVDLLADDLVRA